MDENIQSSLITEDTIQDSKIEINYKRLIYLSIILLFEAIGCFAFIIGKYSWHSIYYELQSNLESDSWHWVFLGSVFINILVSFIILCYVEINIVKTKPRRFNITIITLILLFVLTLTGLTFYLLFIPVIGALIFYVFMGAEYSLYTVYIMLMFIIGYACYTILKKLKDEYDLHRLIVIVYLTVYWIFMGISMAGFMSACGAVRSLG